MRTLVPLKALTVRQPWAWAIAAGHKRVENRDWAPPPGWLGSEVAIHAGAAELDPGDVEYVRQRVPRQPRPQALDVRGCVIAVARVVAVVDSPLRLPEDQRPWWLGRFGWVLDQVRELAEPVPCRGQLGLWALGGSALFDVRDQLEGRR